MKSLIKEFLRIINTILRTKQIFYFTPNRYSSLGNTAVKTKFGFWYVGNILDQKDIACGILHNGLVEEEETNLVLQIFKYLKEKNGEKQTTIFDIGANTGYYSLLSAHFFGTSAKVFSFEPISEYFSCIKESIYLNHYKEIISIVPHALSNSEGVTEIFIDGTSTSIQRDFNNHPNLSSRKIELKVLDNIVKEISARPDFIKIDVEGHELPVLLGSTETIKAYHPIIFIELVQTYKERNYNNKHFEDTIKMLWNAQYEIFSFKSGILKKVDLRDRIEGVCMYLCLPKGEDTNLLEILLIQKNVS